MAKPGARSFLYRLIEAGQLTRRALARPLIEHGLEPGDDALMFLLGDASGAAEDELADALGLSPGALTLRLDRLMGHNLIYRRATMDGPPRIALTPPGERFVKELSRYWDALEESLLRGVRPRRRRQLVKLLSRFTASIGG